MGAAAPARVLISAVHETDQLPAQDPPMVRVEVIAQRNVVRPLGLIARLGAEFFVASTYNQAEESVDVPSASIALGWILGGLDAVDSGVRHNSPVFTTAAARRILATAAAAAAAVGPQEAEAERPPAGARPSLRLLRNRSSH